MLTELRKKPKKLPPLPQSCPPRPPPGWKPSSLTSVILSLRYTGEVSRDIKRWQIYITIDELTIVINIILCLRCPVSHNLTSSGDIKSLLCLYHLSANNTLDHNWRTEVLRDGLTRWVGPKDALQLLSQLVETVIICHRNDCDSCSIQAKQISWPCPLYSGRSQKHELLVVDKLIDSKMWQLW